MLATPVTFRDLCITGADKAVPGTSDDATREILGYSCRKKTILINADGRSEIYEAWVTDRIQTPYRILNGLENLLGGFPLEIEMKQSAQTGFYVRYKAVEIRNIVDEKIFKVPE